MCEDLSFACDENCQVYEDYKELEKLKKQLLGPPYIRKAKFLRELLAKMTKLKTALKEIEEFVEPIYEQIPEDKVLRQILLKINEVLNNVEHN